MYMCYIKYIILTCHIISCCCKSVSLACEITWDSLHLMDSFFISVWEIT